MSQGHSHAGMMEAGSCEHDPASDGDGAQLGPGGRHFDGAGSSQHRLATTPPFLTPVRASGTGRQQDTPRSAPCRPRSARRACSGSTIRESWGSNWHTGEGHAPTHSKQQQMAGPASNSAAAWAEVDLAQQHLAQREREVELREVAARRAEARNRATARQLAELRRRLDDYGQELEEGVMALTNQQNALREERRQTAELQARARRICASGTRDDMVSISSKLNDWNSSRRPWTPTSM